MLLGAAVDASDNEKLGYRREVLTYTGLLMTQARDPKKILIISWLVDKLSITCLMQPTASKQAGLTRARLATSGIKDGLDALDSS